MVFFVINNATYADNITINVGSSEAIWVLSGTDYDGFNFQGTWYSSKPSVADVIRVGPGSTNQVVGYSEGVTTITCSYVYTNKQNQATSGIKTWTITVRSVSPSSISLNYTSMSLEPGGTKQLSASVSPSGASQSVTWSVVSGSSVASVSSSGLVTAKAAGTATVRATSTANSSVYKDCTVTVTEPTPPTSISLNNTSVSLQVGGTRQLIATVSPSGASQSVTWSVVSGSSVASVSSSGLVTAKAAGTATVRATSTVNSSVYKNCTVTVTEPTLEPGTWSGNTLTIGGGVSNSDHNVPYSNYYKYSTTQLIYTPTEIGKSCTINSIAFYVDNATTHATSNVKIYLGHKSTTFSSETDYVSSGNLTLVYSGSPTLGQSTGWETLTFNENSFYYNGIANLVVVITRSSADYTNLLKYDCYTGVGYALYRQNDEESGYASVTNTSCPYTKSTNRPSVRFGIAPSPTSLSLNLTNESMYIGDTKQLNATVYPSNASQSVTWSVTSGSDVVSVSSSGLVTAKAAGTATVRATSTAKNSIYNDCTITVSEVSYSDGEIFTANTAEGVEMTFKVISAADKTCQVGDGSNSSVNSETAGQLTIPSTVKGYTVINIGDLAFGNCRKLSNVNIPNSVTLIGAGSFNNCVSLTSVVIPSSVASMYASSFQNCSNIASIIVEAENKSFDSRDNCNAVITKGSNMLVVGCKNTIIPNSVTSIWKRAFLGRTSLTNITIPNSVTSIEEYAFYNCSNLTSITIGNSVTRIGNYAFEYCSNLSSITIPNSVESIGNDAFSYCSSLTSVVIPNSVMSIGEGAFWINENLTKVTIHGTRIMFGNWAFAGCNKLESVESYDINPLTIDETVFGVVDDEGNYTGFTNASLYVRKGYESKYQTTSGWNLFANIAEMENMQLEDGEIFTANTAEGVKMTYKVISAADKTCQVGNGIISSVSNGTTGQLTIPSTVDGYTVISIGDYAFLNCRKLSNVIIPNSVTGIGEGSFQNCVSLSSVVIPSSVSTINASSFQNCYKITSIIVETGNSTFDSRDNCNAVITKGSNILVVGCQNTIIPNSVTSIADRAFYGRTDLTNITIPNSVTSIGERTFANCSSLRTMVVEQGNIVYDSRNNCNAIIETATNTLISGCSNTEIPNGITHIGKYAFLYCTSLTSITIPNSVTNIEDDAFMYCSGLTSVTIPNSVTSIGANAFRDCSSLASVTIPNSVTSIGLFAFCDCTGLNSIISEIKAPFDIDFVFQSNKNGNKLNATLYVPFGTKSLYEASSGWNQFADIVEMEPVDGEIFAAKTAEGVEMTYKVISAADKTCQVGDGNNSAVNNETTGELTIPGTVNDYTVITIGDKAFENCRNLSNVNIPNSVTSIADKALYGCSGLTSITISKSVTSIGSGAFAECSGLESIVVASSNPVYDSKNNCNAIIETNTNILITGCKNTIIPNSVTAIGEDAFRGMPITSISLPTSLRSIGEFAFDECKQLNEVVIPEGVTTICETAFAGCTSLTTISLPSTLTQIGMDAFSESEGGITTIISNLMEPFAIDKWTFGQEDLAYDEYFNPIVYNTATLYVPAGTCALYQATDGWNLFTNIVEMKQDGNNDETTVKIDGIYYELSDGQSFNNAVGVELLPADEKVAFVVADPDRQYNGDIVIPSSIIHDETTYSVVGIAEGAFAEYKEEHQRNLRSVVIPNSVLIIGEEAFVESSTLQRVEIPNSVICICDDAFGDCKSLREIISYIEVPFEIPSKAFRNIASGAKLYVPYGTKSLYESTDGWNLYATIVEYYSENGLYFVIADANSINAAEDEDYAVMTPDTEVAVLVFAKESAVSNGNVVIPESIVDGNKTYAVEGISVDVFKGMDITSVALPSSLRILGDNVFQDCKHLTKIVIPEGVRAISGDVFSGCTSLNSVTLPSTLTFICRDAFCGTGGSIETVTSYIENPFDIDRWVFSSEKDEYNPAIYNNATLYVPYGTRSLYEAAEGWKEFKAIVECETDVNHDGTVDVTDISTMNNIIYIEPMEELCGTQATISLKMKNSADIRGFQFDLYLPQGVTVVKSSKGKIQGFLSEGRLPDEDEHTLTFSEQSDGAIRFLCSSQYEETFTGNDGEIATLKVNIADDMEDGEYPIQLKSMKLTENNISNFYETTLIQSKLTISTYVLGDINGDGVVDVSDYTGVANHIHGNTPDGFNAKAADVDENGAIDVSDYTGIANIIHTGSIYGNSSNARPMKLSPKKANTNLSTYDNVIYISPFTATAGTQTAISIKMKNTVDIRGFQFDLHLPEGMTVVKSAKGRIQGALSAGRLPDEDEHELTFSEQNDGSIRFLCSSQYDETFTGNDGEIATLQVSVASNMADGDYPIQLTDMKLTETDISKFYTAELIETTVTIGDVDTRIILDETSTTAPEAASNVDVCVKRTINANEWSTICLPFAMTEAQVETVFGDDVELADFIDYDYDDDAETITVNFADATEIEANHPYIIKVSSKVEEFTIDDVDIIPEANPCVEYDNGKTGNKRKVFGTFAGTYVADFDFYNEASNYPLFLSGNKFYYATENTKHMKAFRGYFDFEDCLPEADSAASRIIMSFDNETTGIDDVRCKKEEVRGDYDLQGRKVVKPVKGLYIINGRKEVIK